MRNLLRFCVIAFVLFSFISNISASDNVVCQADVQNTNSCLSANEHVFFLQGRNFGGFHFFNKSLKWTEYDNGTIIISGEVENPQIGVGQLDIKVSGLSQDPPVKGTCRAYDISDAKTYSYLEGTVSIGYYKFQLRDYGINFQVGKNANIFSSNEGYGATGLFKVRSNHVFQSGFLNLILDNICTDNDDTSDNDNSSDDDVSDDDCDSMDSEDFENSWGIWNDGGSDAHRRRLPWVSSFGDYAIRLRDNSNGSNFYSNVLDFSEASSVEVSFNYKAFGYDNKAERFALSVSTDGGQNFRHLKDWRYIYDFRNQEGKSAIVAIDAQYLSSTTVLRFDSHASSNSDQVYIDQIEISVCGDIDMDSDSTDVDSMDMDTTDIDTMDMDTLDMDTIDTDSSDVDSMDMDSSSTDTMGTDSMDVDTSNVDSMDMDSMDIDTSDVDSTDNDSKGCTAVIIDEETFENGLGIWNDGGSDMFRMKDDNGQYVARIRDNSPTSVLESNILNLDDIDGIELSFDFKTFGFSKDSEFLRIEIIDAEDNEVELRQIFLFGEDFSNEQKVSATLYIDNEFLDDQSIIRFIGGGSNNSDAIYLDNIVISSCQGSDSTDVDTTDIDSMDMDSMDVDTSDVDSMNMDSSAIDPMDIDSMDIDSMDIDSMDVDTSDVDSTDNDSTGCTAVIIDEETFENGLGIWNDGGSDMFRMKDDNGQYVARIRDNSPTSVLESDILNLDDIDGIELSFDFKTFGFSKDSEFLRIEFVDAEDNEVELRQIFLFGEDFNNEQKVSATLFVDEEFLDDQSIIRFIGGGSNNSDAIYLDNIVISSCQGSDSTDVDTTDIDSMDMDSMDVDTSDVDSMNMDSSAIDSMDIDSMDIDSMDIDSMDVDTSDVDSTDNDSTGCTAVIIDEETFENGLGIWNDGGSDMFRMKDDNGQYVARIRDNSPTSVLESDILNLDDIDGIELSFDFKTFGFSKDSEFLRIEIIDAEDNEVELRQIFLFGEDFNNEQKVSATLFVDEEFLDNQSIIRFIGGGSNNSDAIYLDNIVISSCQDSDSTDVDTMDVDSMDIDSMNMDSMNVDTSDVDSMDMDSSSIETMDIDSMDIDSMDMDSMGVDTSDVDSMDMDSSSIDTMNIDSMDIDSMDMDTMDVDTSDVDSMDMDTSSVDSMDIDSMDVDSIDMDSSSIDSMDIDSMDIDSMDTDTMDVDTSDVDSMDMDSSSIDSMDIDSMDIDSMDMDSMDIDTSDVDSMDMDSMDVDTSDVDSMDIDSSFIDTMDIDSMDIDSMDMDTMDVDTSDVDSIHMDTSSIVTMDIDSMNIDSMDIDSSEMDSSRTTSSNTPIDTAEFTELVLAHTEDALAELEEFGIFCGENIIDIESFEDDMGIWNDGGSDCFRIWTDSLSSDGEFSVRLRDNSSSSRMFTEELDLSAYNAVTVTLDFIAIGFDGNHEDLLMEVSFDGGKTFNLVDQLANSLDFDNEEMYRATFLIEGEPFTTNTVLQIRCDASSNSDKLYIDNILITSCIEIDEEELLEEATQSRSKDHEERELDFNYSLYPNPTHGMIHLDLEKGSDSPVRLNLIDAVGRTILTKTIAPFDTRQQINLQDVSNGIYILSIENNNQIWTERIIISK